MSRQRSARAVLTQRALDDLIAIEDYSTKQWGKRVADRYLGDMEAALGRIAARPDLLEAIDAAPSALCYHRVGKHLLMCDRRESRVVVLTVLHASMDIPSRLAEIMPTLSVEVELLHERLRRAPNKRR